MSERIEQEITIAAGAEDIFNQLISWGESRWWPKRSLMEFSNLSGKVEEGTVYLQKVKVPFGPSWRSRNEIIDYNRRYIKRTFSDGMFDGFEELKVIDSGQSKKAVYLFNSGVIGTVNRIIWKLITRNQHIKNIDLILSAMKEYLEKS